MKQGGMVTRGEVQKQLGANTLVEDDLLAIEAPLQIQLEWGEKDKWRKENLSVTMRTPGHDFDLVRGFLWAEGLLSSIDDLQWIRYCIAVPTSDQGNVIIAKWMPDKKPAREPDIRIHSQHSSCGICGKSYLPDFPHTCKLLEDSKHTNLTLAILNACYKSTLQLQTGFKFTGGFHGVALFNRKGELLVLREDVGRHNAMDKVVGAALISPEISLSESFVWLSGRVSYEMVQKACMAKIPVIAAVGAPTSLAVEMANEKGITLIGFLREDRMNIYTHPYRVSQE
jgi:FdhD protein